MPSYDYICRKCGKKFTLVMTISEHDRKKIRCPKCSSVRAEQQYHPFFAVTSKKS
jgi:putative FmdB family regulatory protein